MCVSHSQNHQKFGVTAAKEDKKRRYFYISLLPAIPLTDFNRNLERIGLDL